MKYGDNEGFTEVTIPAQKFRSCHGCKYFSSRMVKSGLDPIYANNCEHPDIKYKGNWMRGNLSPNHLNIVETPDWCPYLNQTNKS